MSMFYDLVGNLLTRGGEALTLRHMSGTTGDERTAREFRQIAVLLRRVGDLWPEIFDSLIRESAILASTRDDVFSRIQQVHPGWQPLGADDVSPSDPLRQYRRLWTELEDAVGLLHEHAGEPWASDALTVLREGMESAAEVQGRLVDKALSL